MTIQYLQDYTQEDDYINTEDEKEKYENIVSFNNIVFKDDILQMYLKDIGKVKLLKRNEEQQLGMDIINSNKEKALKAKIKLL